MTYDEYNTLVTNIVKTPEKAPEMAQKLLEAIKVDTDTLESQKVHTGELEAKIKDLQDTNIKLFLNQTKPQETEQEEKPVDPGELAKQIMEG